MPFFRTHSDNQQAGTARSNAGYSGNNGVRMHAIPALQKTDQNRQMPVQRLVAIASENIESEKEKTAKDATNFDGALVSGGWEAQKLTGGPIKLLSDITNDELKDKDTLSIVGHGNGKGTTGDIPIGDVVADLADKEFGKKKEPDKPDSKRTAHVNLFSCLSGTKIYNADGSDAQKYKSAFNARNIESTILAPKGIAITDMAIGASKVTSIKHEHTAAYSVNSFYSKIRNYWTVVASAAGVDKKKTYTEILDMYSKSKDTKKEDKFKEVKKDLGKYSHPGMINAEYAEKIKAAYGLETKEQGEALPASLLKLLTDGPKNDMQTKILLAACDHYSKEKNKYRLEEDEEFIMPLDKDPIELMKAELADMKQNYGIAGGEVENTTGEDIPDTVKLTIDKLSNKDNWIFL